MLLYKVVSIFLGCFDTDITQTRGSSVSFLTANIDRAIVITQYDLRGFYHPLGFRCSVLTPKHLDAITNNFLFFAAGCGRDKIPTVANLPDYHRAPYKDYLATCKKFVADCDLSQIEAIQLIILDIVKKNGEMRAKVDAGEMPSSPYLRSLDKDNHWGRAVLALVEAFNVELN